MKQILFAKSVSVLLLQGKLGVFAQWQTWLLLAGLLSTIYLQLRWTNEGLRRFSALYVAPTFQAFWITVSVLGGLMVFNEFDDLGAAQRLVFATGVLMTIAGVFCLTQQGKPEQFKKDSIKLHHYVPLLFCFLVLYLLLYSVLHSNYSICKI